MAATAAVAAQNAVPRNSDRVGVFADGPGEFLAVSLIGSGERQMLVLAETRTDQLRILFPAGADSFLTGPSIAQQSPRERTVRFVRGNDGVEAITVMTADSSSPRRYPRIQLRREEVRFFDGDVELRGTLYLQPRSSTRGAAIVLAHGSEVSDRNSFGPIPWVLAARGYVVLAYDKRGTGASSGSWKDVGLEPLGADLAAAVDYVAKRGEVDRHHIGVLGTSEGGWVAAIAARRTPNIRAIAAISGGARTKGDAYVYKMKRLANEAGLTGSRLDSAVAEAETTIRESKARVAMDSSTTTGFDRRVTYDPTSDWRRFRGAFLYMGGEADVLESAPEAASWFNNLFERASHPDYTIKLVPLGTHSLLRSVTATPSEFATLTGIRGMVPGYWSILLRWLDDRLK